MADVFIQALQINGQTVPTARIIETTYIERMDMTGPKLLLKIADREKYYQDDIGLDDGSQLFLSIGDADGRGEALFSDTFIVGANWSEGDTLHIEAMQADIYAIKQPVTKPEFFVSKTPAEILKTIFPECQLVVDPNYSARQTYHVLTGATHGIMLEQLARDYGAAMWLARGKIYFKRLSTIMDATEAYKFEYMRNASDNPLIQQYTRYRPQRRKLRELQRDYMCWDPERGMVTIGNGYPRQFLPARLEHQLKPHNYGVMNDIDCIMSGNGQFTPGQVIKLELNRETQETLLDESVPAVQLMLGVRHYQQGKKFISVCELGEVMNAN